MFGFKKPEKSAEKKDDKSLVDSAQNGSNVKGSPSQTFQLRQMANQDKAYVSNNAYANFTKELKSLSEKHKHLGEYLVNFTADENNNLPEFRGRFSRGDKFPGQRNLIYPAGNGVFIHILYDPGDTRDEYITIEPSQSEGVAEISLDVDKRLMDFIDELMEAEDNEKRHEILLECLEKICVVTEEKVTKKNNKKVYVTQDQYDGLKYLIYRDKIGLGLIEPLITDPYIEDISCSGVGQIFVEHKILGGLKSTVTFDTADELDRYVIKLSEKISRPVTVREPIVDAVLPDGSRINIVYGGDVSKRGSNFSIRKFTATPLSILDLLSSGSMSYEMAAYVSLMLNEGMNTFVSGETASGKTTLLNAVSSFIPPNSKIVSIEDTPELQVPHKNWIREVVRGGSKTGASVTMFDLLRAALRQRPNEIIIGEIRGEEGAIAFQAMQTGHACMATFHAASVEKLIQRLTGNPINVPKTYVDNLNMVMICAAVRLANGQQARRVLSINEIIEYDAESNAFGFIEVFRWEPSTDTFEFPGYMNTYLLENVVAVKRGLPPDEARSIYKDIERRAKILKRLQERGTTNFYELHNVISKAYREGQF